MSPRAYMIWGAVVGVLITAIDLFPTAPGTGWLAFAAGALFGKGYGIWEERARAALRPAETGDGQP